MLELRNKTRGASKVGYLVKVVRDGFKYVGAGDTPIGVVAEVVPSGEMCKIQINGEALVYVGHVVSENAILRLPLENRGELSGVAYSAANESVYISIGNATGKGKGLVRVALNITSAGVSAGGSLPVGGASGAVLTKASAADHDVTWSTITGYATESWVNSNFDNYVGWYYRPVAADDPTQQALIGSGDAITILGGTGIGTAWTGGDTLTITNTMSAGSMDRWYLNTDHVDSPKSIQNDAEVRFIGGTGIDLTEVVWNTGTLKWEMTIASTITASPWTTDTNGITYAAGNVGIGVASDASYKLEVYNSVNSSNIVLINNPNTGTSAGAGIIMSANGNNVQLTSFGDTHSTYGANHSRLFSSAGGATIGIGSSTELGFLYNSNGSVDLYYNNSKKLETTNVGIDVTGAITSSGEITAWA